MWHSFPDAVAGQTGGPYGWQEVALAAVLLLVLVALFFLLRVLERKLRWRSFRRNAARGERLLVLHGREE